MGEQPVGAVTFLFTDIEGSTRLWEEHPSAMADGLARHDALVRDAIEARSGVVFTTGGDGFGAVFARAGDAVAAALEAQRRLAAEAWVDGCVIGVRMGLHTGTALPRGGDFFGPVVNRTARLMSAAHAGQVVTSATTAALVESSDGVDLVDLGWHQLRGVASPLRVFGAVTAGDRWSGPAVGSAVRTGNLPVPITDFVGQRPNWHG